MKFLELVTFIHPTVDSLVCLSSLALNHDRMLPYSWPPFAAR